MFDDFGPIISNNIELPGDKPFLAKGIGVGLVFIGTVRALIITSQVSGESILLFSILSMYILVTCIREERE